jgi:hypothetical protein
MTPAPPLSNQETMELIEGALNRHPERPWCIHRLYEEVVRPEASSLDRDLFDRTERAAQELAAQGRVRGKPIDAIAIGVHCEDAMYWSIHSRQQELEEFGREYESPAILNRLASHFRCTGL